MQELAAKDIASRAQQDQAKTNLEAARSRLQAAQADLGAAERATADSRVTTRFAGVIGRRFVSRGEFVQPGQKLFELVSLDPVEVEFSLPESDASRLTLGLPLEVTVAPYPGEVFHATVSMISPVVDERTRTLRVKALLANPDGRLRPGLFARADLGIAKREGVVLVPEEAVLQRADGAVVFRANDGATSVERRVVRLVRIKDGQAEIDGGLAAGDSVVVRGHAGAHRRRAHPRAQCGWHAGRGVVGGEAGARQGGQAVSLSDICIKRPVLTLMMTLSLVVFGVLGYVELGVDQMPEHGVPQRHRHRACSRVRTPSRWRRT